MIGELIRVRYEIIEELASSPIFQNYVARDRVRNVDVCLRFVKDPFAREPEFVQALAATVERTRVLDHPNIARVLEVDEHEGRPFFICELVRGSSLAVRIGRVAPFTPSVACEIGVSICEALEHAATQSVLHGDLSADHVISTLEGHISVIDFGLWTSYGASKTAGGVVLDRMAPYLAPEIVEGGMPTPASDVYAVGVILFELLTGRKPFSGQTPAAVLARHQTQAVPSVRAFNPAVPHVLDEIASKAMAKDPKDRYGSATALLGDLRRLLDALRFGKKLEWPINDEEAAAPEPVPAKTFAEKKRERRLGEAVHTQSFVKRARKTKAKKSKSGRKPASMPEADVPRWLKAVVYMLAGMAVFGVGSYIYFNLTKASVVKVPMLTGMPFAEARETAGGLNLLLENVGEEYSNQYPQPKTVISMDPAPGTPVREGSSVSVRLSRGSRTVEVPDMRGLTVAQARGRIEAQGLQIDPSTRWARSGSVESGRIIATDPGARERVERRTLITLTVSTGEERPEKPPVDPEDLFANIWSLEFEVEGPSGEPVLVRVEMTDARREKRVIFEETREGGEQVVLEAIEGMGGEAIFRIFFNGFLGPTIRKEGSSG